MPRYDYRCPTCSATKTLNQSMSHPLPADLPCGYGGCEDRARRVFEAPAAIHFHGPGFYATDVKSALHRRRRPNPGDGMHQEFQPDTERIARSI